MTSWTTFCEAPKVYREMALRSRFLRWLPGSALEISFERQMFLEKGGTVGRNLERMRVAGGLPARESGVYFAEMFGLRNRETLASLGYETTTVLLNRNKGGSGVIQWRGERRPRWRRRRRGVKTTPRRPVVPSNRTCYQTPVLAEKSAEPLEATTKWRTRRSPTRCRMT